MLKNYILIIVGCLLLYLFFWLGIDGFTPPYAFGISVTIAIVLFALVELDNYKDLFPKINRNKVPVVEESSLEDIFNISNTTDTSCPVTTLPDPISTLKTNMIKLDSPEVLKQFGDKIVDFYNKRKVQISYIGGESGPKVNLLKFVDSNQDGQFLKTNDVKKYLTDLTRELTTVKYPIGPDDITFVEVIPGESAFGLYIPSKQKNVVRLYNLLGDTGFTSYIDKNTRIINGECLLNSVPFLLGSGGKLGEVIYTDSVVDPHLLIAGATGSGKSISLNSLISTLLMLHTPKTLNLYLGDPKFVEFSMYKNIPHVKKLENTPDAIISMLEERIEEMMRRYTEVLPKGNYKKLSDYNAKVKTPNDFIPYDVIIIDEFADIMLSENSDNFVRQVQRIAQMGRAAGVFLVIATQRPSVKVIPGEIKANLDNRVAFKCTSETDSRIILDNPAAATLLGKGDGILKTANTITRFQGVFTDSQELDKIIDFWKI